MLKYWPKCITFCTTNSSGIKQLLCALDYIFITITGLIFLVFCVVFLCSVCPSSCVLCVECYQCLWLVCLRPVSCVSNVSLNVTSVSGLFVFVQCLVCRMLPVSLACLSSSSVLCVECYQCLWLVRLRPVSCVPNVTSVSGLFVFVLCFVPPMLPVSLDCLSSSCVLRAQCYQCLWLVCLRPVSCVPNVTSVSGLFVFVLCLVCPMLPVSLACLSSSCVLCAQCYQCLGLVCLRPVSCVPNVTSISGLFVFVLCLVCQMLPVSLACLFSSCVLCAKCYQCLLLVCLRPVSCVPNVTSVSGLFVFVLCLVCRMLPVSLACLSSSCVLCAQCYQYFWLVCLRPVSCVPNVTSVSELFVLRPVSCVSNVTSVSELFVFVLCLVCPMLPVSLNCFSSSCVLCAQCYQYLWIVCLRPVSCVPNVISISELFVFVLCLVCPMLSVSLNCLSSSCVLCAQCYQCLWIVCRRPVSCVPNVTSVSGLFVFVLCLVCPMLPVSLACLSSSCVLYAECYQCLGLGCPSSCVLCAECYQCLWIVCHRPVSCVPNVISISELFVFVLCLVCRMLPVSLNCLSSSCVLCAQCYQYL